MTEQEWLGCDDPLPALIALVASGRASSRKLRLFGAACSRRAWGLLDRWGRAAVEVAEQYADGLAGPDELRAARLACRSAGGSAAWYAAASNPAIAARNAALSARAGAGLPAEPAAQAVLLRCVFGNPFRPVAPGPWITPAAVRLAQECYDRRDFSALPRLCDLLEEAGCPVRTLLEHGRRDGEHVRGCWVVDLVLGKS
jgi:hypothetical protein